MDLIEQAGKAADDPAAELIEAGAEIAGGIAGGALELLGGPGGVAGGAVGGVIVTRSLRRAGAELRKRWLSPREEVRVGGAITFAAASIQERLDAGEEPRDDGFFQGGSRSGADELLEGVLLEASRSYEERKVPCFGRLYAAIVFEPRISAAYGHFLVRMLERLTYRQLATLAFLRDPASAPTVRELDASRGEGGSKAADDIIAELDELGRTGVIGVGQPGGAVTSPTNTWGRGSFSDIDLGGTALTLAGADLWELAGLDEISKADKNMVANALWGGWRIAPRQSEEPEETHGS